MGSRRCNCPSTQCAHGCTHNRAILVASPTARERLRLGLIRLRIRPRVDARTASVFHGSAMGIPVIPTRVLEGAAAGDFFGCSVASVGDRFRRERGGVSAGDKARLQEVIASRAAPPPRPASLCNLVHSMDAWFCSHRMHGACTVRASTCFRRGETAATSSYVLWHRRCTRAGHENSSRCIWCGVAALHARGGARR